MRSITEIKNKYFYAKTDMWSSLRGGDQHKIKYNRRNCFFDGYRLTDNQRNIIIRYDNHNNDIKPGGKFKLLSTLLQSNGIKNYLGECVDTGVLITFDEEQITFNEIENEESI
jgi:hypothetical protein